MRDEKGHFLKGSKHSEEIRKKISDRHKGKPAKWISSPKRDEIAKKISKTKKGKPNPKQAGKNAWNWKGGITPLYLKIRHSLEIKKWRTAVFIRDNFTCVWCGQVGGKLHADHIIPFQAIIEKVKFELGNDDLYNKVINYPLFNDINNGRTLCVSCHAKTPTYGRPKKIKNENTFI